MNADRKPAAALDPVALEVLRGRLTAIADEMEFVLLQSSWSSIITEALDATCAVFDARGRTVAQSCAIPVHLGVLCELGRTIAARYPPDAAAAGDVYIVNDPYSGGTHLPDICVASPVFCGVRLVGYVATMVHYQDIGGSAPGSTSASAFDHLAEGMRIPLIRLAAGGDFEDDIIDMLAANSRSPDNVRGDLNAQIAACRRGEERLAAVFEHQGIDAVESGIAALMDYAERLTRLAIERIPDGDYGFADRLDDDGLSPDADPVEIRGDRPGSRLGSRVRLHGYRWAGEGGHQQRALFNAGGCLFRRAGAHRRCGAEQRWLLPAPVRHGYRRAPS